ncbi:unnamed protein product [Meloidogyne enterolobii]|uniref:Uncharacterized protein n=1 Tax=Meloidogyne enterolobii TaxID=390850 RepID=A0ACB0XL28_MELEN
MGAAPAATILPLTDTVTDLVLSFIHFPLKYLLSAPASTGLPSIAGHCPQQAEKWNSQRRQQPRGFGRKLARNGDNK